jgi:lipopolysaccharide export system protein LptA
VANAETPWSQARAAARIALLLGALLAPTLGAAAGADREQPINVRARSVEINEKTGIAVYRGDVVVRQGEMELRGERVEVRSRANRPEQIHAYGKPATVRQGPDLISASEIHYFVNDKRLEARSADADDARVQAVIQPPPPHEPAAR